MRFLDRKENVLDIELTQYGKYLLSIGQFKPEYYAFFDDDVLYDAQYAGITSEDQNSIHDRIKEVPQCSVQYVFHGLETEITKNNKFIRAGEVDKHGIFSRLSSKKVQAVPEKHYALSAPLGTISLESDNAPAWSVNVLKGEISGSIHYQTGDQPTLKIPLLTMKSITFKTVAEQDQALEQVGGTLLQQGLDSEFGAPSDLSFLVRKFKDGSFINVYEDSIVLEIEELNTLFENENFDIEVFKVEEEQRAGNTREVLIPLSFATNKKSLVRNNILLDDKEIKAQNDLQPEIDTSCVEYFFDVFTDTEVDNTIICKYANNKTENTLTGRIVECNEVEKVSPNKLYTSNVKEEDLKGC